MTTKKYFLLGLIALALAGCKTELYTNLIEIDANNMLALLIESKIGAEKIANKKYGTYSLNIDESQLPKAVVLLKEHGYPRKKLPMWVTCLKKMA